MKITSLSYKGNIGFEEMVKFYQKADEKYISLMENYIKANDWDGVKSLFKKVLNVSLAKGDSMFKITASEKRYILKLRKIQSATDEQKDIVKRLRLLTKKLNLKSAKYKSFSGKAGYVEVHLFKGDETFDVDLRNKALDAIYGKEFKRDRENPSAGNVTSKTITMFVREWDQVLKSYNL